MERITNSCFQDTEFATVMKGKHVFVGSDKDREDVNNMVTQSYPIQPDHKPEHNKG